jgi:hypothetical protein
MHGQTFVFWASLTPLALKGILNTTVSDPAAAYAMAYAKARRARSIIAPREGNTIILHRHWPSFYTVIHRSARLACESLSNASQ